MSPIPTPLARRFAILTCTDVRLDPSACASLAAGDAHVIRQAGGRASDDAIRSLLLSHTLLGTREWFVVHPAPAHASAQTVVDDVTRIRRHPLVPPTIAIYGYVHDPKTGRLVEVPAATAAGVPHHEEAAITSRHA